MPGAAGRLHPRSTQAACDMAVAIGGLGGPAQPAGLWVEKVTSRADG
jgi:hypothetical protein